METTEQGQTVEAYLERWRNPPPPTEEEWRKERAAAALMELVGEGEE